MEKTKPLVSVVIPAYNRAALLGRAVNSVLEQSFQDFEILIVDDGSTDNTAEVVQGFEDPRIRYIRHAKNAGEAAARNTGIHAARGQYVAFLDSDDYWLAGKLELQVRVLEADEAMYSCSTQYYEIKGSRRKICPRTIAPWPRYLLEEMDLGIGTTLLIRRDCYEKVGIYDETIVRSPDYEWLIRYGQMFPHHLIKNPMAVVHIGGGKPNPETVETAMLSIIEKHHSFFYSYGKWRGRKAEARRHREMAMYFFRADNRQRGWYHLKRAFEKYPLQPIRFCLLLIDVASGVNLLSKAIARQAGATQ
jgi:glycosyltransferase involved in cell wall biosynthesis